MIKKKITKKDKLKLVQDMSLKIKKMLEKPLGELKNEELSSEAIRMFGFSKGGSMRAKVNYKKEFERLKRESICNESMARVYNDKIEQMENKHQEVLREMLKMQTKISILKELFMELKK